MNDSYICEYCGGQGMMAIQPIGGGIAFNRMCPQCKGTGSPLDLQREQSTTQKSIEHKAYVMDKCVDIIEKFQRKHLEKAGLK